MTSETFNRVPIKTFSGPFSWIFPHSTNSPTAPRKCRSRVRTRMRGSTRTRSTHSTRSPSTISSAGGSIPCFTPSSPNLSLPHITLQTEPYQSLARVSSYANSIKPDCPQCGDPFRTLEHMLWAVSFRYRTMIISPQKSGIWELRPRCSAMGRP